MRSSIGVHARDCLNSFKDLIDGTDPVDLTENAFRLVKRRDRHRLPMKRLQTLAHGLFRVIGPCNDFGAAAVAHAVVRRGLILQMVNRPALRTRPPQRDPADDGVVRDEQLENPEVPVSIPDAESVQLLGLNQRPREAVQDEALRGVRPASRSSMIADHQVVRDQLPRGHDRRGLLPELGYRRPPPRGACPPSRCAESRSGPPAASPEFPFRFPAVR